MQILERDTLPKGGFKGVREYRLVTDARTFGADAGKEAWSGLGSLVYLADARIIPGGETGMHDHHEIDVISLMVEGAIHHEGSLEPGQTLRAGDVQVQRAGSEGFAHNEINPDDSENRMIQIWVLPENSDEAAAYRSYRLKADGLTRVYGGEPQQEQTFASGTLIDIAQLQSGQSMDIDVPFLAYLVRGKGFVNEESVSEGALMRGEQLTFDTTENAQLIIVHLKAD